MSISRSEIRAALADQAEAEDETSHAEAIAEAQRTMERLDVIHTLRMAGIPIDKPRKA